MTLDEIKLYIKKYDFNVIHFPKGIDINTTAWSYNSHSYFNHICTNENKEELLRITSLLIQNDIQFIIDNEIIEDTYTVLTYNDGEFKILDNMYTWWEKLDYSKEYFKFDPEKVKAFNLMESV